MYDYGLFKFESKQDLFDKAIRFWNPDKTRFWQKAEIDLVIDRRENYFLYDMPGRRLIDLHLNGGTYNFGHRHPELVETLKGALDYFDMGNHWFPSVARAALAEALINISPGMKYAVFATGGERFTKIFLSDQPETFIQVPFNDIDAMERALKGKDVAALIIETIPATYGFPMPKQGYLNACKALCEKYGAMYIADEVQTGLMRTGQMWGWQAYGVQPDIMVTAKGLSGGLYPISAALVNEKAGGWLHEDGAAHISTSGGAELGSVVAHKVVEMLQRAELVANVQTVTHFMAEMISRHGDMFTGVRQKGVILGLEFSNHPEGAVLVSRALYEHAVWAIFSSLDKRVLQWKPGVLLTRDTCEDIMDRFDAAMPRARIAASGEEGCLT
jgi:acetylornithine/succinyldiaminopimelate/putrescine aminotransferase